MKTCFLKIGDAEVAEYKLDLTGYGSVPSGTECRARETWWLSDRKWVWVRIGEKVDHIGSPSNRGGAVYAAVIVRVDSDTKPKDRSDSLFGGDAS